VTDRTITHPSTHGRVGEPAPPPRAFPPGHLPASPQKKRVDASVQVILDRSTRGEE
jgi:hypothetical protein